MKHRHTWKRDVDECCDKIWKILKEYNCEIEHDPDLGVILFDKDTQDFTQEFLRESE